MEDFVNCQIIKINSYIEYDFIPVFVFSTNIDVNLLKTWLQLGETNITFQNKFTVDYVTEIKKNDQDIREYLKSLFILSAADSQILESIRKMDGWETAVDLLVTPVLPTNDKFKRGFFGEVLIPKLLADFF